jgi:hypothetical protein
VKLLHHGLIEFIVIISLVGCSFEGESSNIECTDTEVPCLEIFSGADSVKAVRGTTSWKSFEADSEAPPQLVSYQEGELHAELDSKIKLQFSEKPYSFKVYIWNDEARGTELPLESNSIIANQSGNFIYEIKAEWAEGYAHYAFKINVD